MSPGLKGFGRSPSEGGESSPAPKKRARRKAPSATLGSRNRHRKVDPDSIAKAPAAGQTPPDEEWFADPAITAELRRERLVRHQALVRDLAKRLSSAGYEFFEAPYDVLATQDGRPSALIEVKTLDGTLLDEIAQVRSALAQLHYYEHFEVPAAKRPHGLIRLAFFEHRLRNKHVGFLEALETAGMWLETDGAIGAGPWSVKLLAHLGLL
jgi:hypothetical protein